MKIIETNNGGLKLVLDGHMYTKHAIRKCSRKSSINCQGQVGTNLQNEHAEVTKSHNHSLTKLRPSMKRRAAQTRDKPGQIYAAAVSDYAGDVIALLPDPETCKRTLRNQRPTPPAPTHRSELGVISEEFKRTFGDAPESFLIYDNGPHNHDIILALARKKGLEVLANAETIYMDGNFKMAPKIFSQVSCIRVPYSDTTITAVYALLPNKTRACYEELLQAVVDKCEEMHTKFFNLVGHHHPSVWRTIEWFHKEQTTVRTVFAQDTIGNMPVKNPVFIKMQKRQQ